MFGKLLGTAMVALLSVSTFADTSAPQQPSRQAKKIRWVLAHEPVGLFKNAADYFAKDVEKKSHGRLQVEVLTLPEYSAKYNNGAKVRQEDVVHYIQSGQMEMSQTYTTVLGELDHDMYALDLPFLFRDHKHAAAVLDGEIGAMILAGLDAANVHGLAFTYSGGNRVIPAKTAIRTMDDFTGLKIRTSGSPVAVETFRAIGAIPVPMGLDDIGSATKAGQITAAESTYPRYFELKQDESFNVMNDTKHSLFLTSIIIGETFWKNLDPELQQAVRQSAVEAALLERKESIADADKTLQKCRQKGIQVVELPALEHDKFRAATRGVYDKFTPTFSPGLVQQIESN